jgi:hypothetical protein
VNGALGRIRQATITTKISTGAIEWSRCCRSFLCRQGESKRLLSASKAKQKNFVNLGRSGIGAQAERKKVCAAFLKSSRFP